MEIADLHHAAFSENALEKKHMRHTFRNASINRPMTVMFDHRHKDDQTKKSKSTASHNPKKSDFFEPASALMNSKSKKLVLSHYRSTDAKKCTVSDGDFGYYSKIAGRFKKVKRIFEL